MNTVIIITMQLNKKFFFSYCIKISNPSLNELKQIAKKIRINTYKKLLKEELSGFADELDNYSKNHFNDARRKRNKDRFLETRRKKF